MGVCKIECKGGKTKQSFKDECDINKLMKRYQKKGILPPMKNGVAVFGDCSDPIDYVEANNRLIAARASFDALSLEVRKRFNYDPYNLLVFLNDEKNREEGIKLGLIEKKKDVEPAPAPESAPKTT